MSLTTAIKNINTEQAMNEDICLTASQILKIIPRESIDKALCDTDRTKRREGHFPDHLVVYFVILMGLFMDLSYTHVFEKLISTLAWLYEPFFDLKILTSSAIVQARQRIGLKSLQSLFNLISNPIATNITLGAFFCNLRLVCIDGTSFDAYNTTANSTEFGHPSNDKSISHYPQVKCVALIEYATRVVIDLEFGPYTGASEQSLASPILSRLKPDMLCLADRLYPCFKTCNIVVNAGAHFVWRLPKHFKFIPEHVFSDGSYLAKLYERSNDHHKKLKTFIMVRIIEYQKEDSSEKYRLITNILDSKLASAKDLAMLYPKRWAQETVNNEIKNTLRKPQLILRSKSPDLVLQELYGLFIAHYIVRFFMLEAAHQDNIQPDWLSFKHAVYIIKNKLPNIGNFLPKEIYSQIINGILNIYKRVKKRPGRQYSRVVKDRRSRYPAAPRGHTNQLQVISSEIKILYPNIDTTNESDICLA